LDTTVNSVNRARRAGPARAHFQKVCSRGRPSATWLNHQPVRLNQRMVGSRKVNADHRSVARMRNFAFALAALLLTSSPMQAQDYTLSPEDIAFLNQIDKSDRFFSELGREADGMAALNRVLGVVASGPVKISIAWNKGTIEGWKKANAKLVELNQQLICLDIQAHLIDTENTEFFEQLSFARGCDS
jgi:hypothetical protein